MRITLISVTLLSIILFSIINPSKSECCGVPIKCRVGRSITYRCKDCTESTPYCGKGMCNIFGCNCDGGCREGNSSLFCWSTSSGCISNEFFEATGAEKLFTIIDTDSDEKISLTEAKEYFRQIRPTNVNIDEEFHKLDISNDGFLTLDEIDGH